MMNEAEARKAVAIAGWGNQVRSDYLKYAFEEIDRLRAAMKPRVEAEDFASDITSKELF